MSAHSRRDLMAPPPLDADDCDAARCGCGRGARRDGALWRVALAELVGTALLVLLSCLAACAPGAAALPLHRALAAGFVVTALVQTLDHISGAFFNPTVLLAAVLWGRVGGRRALALGGAQLAGAVLGAGALHALQPAAAASCVTRPAPGLPLHEAALIECVLGGCLALANCGAWDPRSAERRDSWPTRIGLTVAALSLVAGELTGASMNPARSFGPALWSGAWDHHWIYWVSPLSGSLMCTLVYIAAWRPLPLPLPPGPRKARPPQEARDASEDA
ncbi:unnamed protein product [Arctia plantaginis]|uniref:Uncharacterized protein n=1 Tax=Arctia plantaginis TaxID=874455 RepID=A0A8S1A4A3_ARCPL|nr:unnamed protein product [Arctia plantaginis]